jgi:hypothetical protein
VSAAGRNLSKNKHEANSKILIHFMKKEIVMKNTVKKILALVFAVVMVCSLAVPAFAAEDIAVDVIVVDRDGKIETYPNVPLTDKTANIEKALKNTIVNVNTTTGTITKVDDVKVTDKSITGYYGTGEYIVSLNGKAQNDDLGTVAVADGDVIVVYWADSKLGTKLALVDDSNIAMGIVSLYYYDAEGVAQPLTGAKVTLRKADGSLVRDYTNIVDAENKIEARKYEYHFTTDEKGQIWIAPQDLDSADVFTIETPTYNLVDEAAADLYEGVKSEDIFPIVNPLSPKASKFEDGKDNPEYKYIVANADRNIVDVLVVGATVEVADDMYDVAGETGDMTMVYVLVAAAAIVTLGAVVVMKKKSVKAN